MKRYHLRGAACVLGLAALSGCRPAAPQEGLPSARVSVMPATPVSFEVVEELPGRILPLRVAEIRAQVSGIVQRRLFEQGSEVRAGQPLFRINPSTFKAEAGVAAAALQRAEAVLHRAQLQAERLRPLIEKDAVSRQAYDDAVSQRDQAVADVAQCRAALVRRELDLRFATVDAPIPGRIEQALVTEGALVGSADSSPMARIQQIDQVYVDVRCPGSALDALRAFRSTPKGSGKVPFGVELLGAAGTPVIPRGRLLFSGFTVEAGTGDVLMRLQVDNPERRLLPGMFVRARLVLRSYPSTLTLPDQAVVRSGGQPQVWTVDRAGQSHLKPVDLAEHVNGSYRVRSGLQAGELIVVEGMERLSEGARAEASTWTPQVTPQGPDTAPIR